MKLHLGCGDKILKDFINIDIRESEGVDMVLDITKLDTIENNSVDLIYCSHVLEHFGRHSYKKILQNWYEKLKYGGMIRIAVPNFESIVEHYNKNKDIKVLLGLLYGGQTYEQNYHYCCWDFKSLSEDLYEIGFRIVEKYEWEKTEHSNVDDYSQSYLPHMDKTNGILMSLNIEAIK
jgi:ubiquinone/menaquinone biosynthesis C-methylase UbiE